MFLILSSIFFLLSTTNPQNPPPSSSCTQPLISPVSATETLTNCKKLPTLGAEFGWKVHVKNESTTTTRIDIYFGARLPKRGWMAWGVNPSERPKMVGTRALIGIRHQNGSSKVMTYNVTAYTKHGCQLLPSVIDVMTQNMSSEYVGDSGYFKMYATLFLDDLVYNVSRLNHVWQTGHGFVGSEVMMHETSLENFDSSETIDLKIGRSKSVERHRMRMRTVHGILNIVGWGTLLPMGVVIARYCRKFPIKWKPWFRFHIMCQVSGYVLGTTGWAIGLWLGHASPHYYFQIHRILGILIFTLATLQISALRLMPSPNDAYRRYWNIYHHFFGYAILVVVSINIFQGIAILKPNQQPWKLAYLSLLAIFASITIFFEIFTWSKFLLSKATPPND